MDRPGRAVLDQPDFRSRVNLLFLDPKILVGFTPRGVNSDNVDVMPESLV